ncbi:hypothetical protein IV203_035540 [Nitzschia inconspicua]|uniref:Uncharacterized protein n=1 Tax=Nitzschia inconspicua TaxID=303405 RepID=A0A9K3LGE6_9STRA|nr:hypothetical protein IV203_035540 [Nitzschia inconspicua]
MMLYHSLLFLSITAIANGELSRQECIDQGGQVVGDIGDGAIFSPSYLCESNGMPPIDIVVATDGEPIATDGEVCCSTAEGGGISDAEAGISEAECNAQGGVLVDNIAGCIDQLPALGTVASDPARQDTLLCCPGGATPVPPPATDRIEYTRQECLQNNGIIVGDIGDGAIFQPEYVCESNGQPPLANILQDTPPFAIEGEVCCGMEDEVVAEEEDNDSVADRDEITRQECIERGGQIVGDIGDGATQRDDYLCETNGEPPIANVVADEGEPIAIEGEICCGTSEPANEDWDVAGNSTLMPTEEDDFDFNSTLMPTEDDDFDVNVTMPDDSSPFPRCIGAVVGAIMVLVTTLLV